MRQFNGLRLELCSSSSAGCFSPECRAKLWIMRNIMKCHCWRCAILQKLNRSADIARWQCLSQETRLILAILNSITFSCLESTMSDRMNAVANVLGWRRHYNNWYPMNCWTQVIRDLLNVLQRLDESHCCRINGFRVSVLRGLRLEWALSCYCEKYQQIFLFGIIRTSSCWTRVSMRW